MIKTVPGAIIKLGNGALTLRVTASIIDDSVVLHRAIISEPFKGNDVLFLLNIENTLKLKESILLGNYSF